ncbi:NAD-dependent epimerase/dehydratase family protein, partial [bacterium]|nr:NAD-dependent epimerase/dehydratase family protein [bacterium]
FDDPGYDLKTNCLSTLLLADWCLRQKISRFIYTSSMSIYGDQEVQPVQESSMPSPKSFYGVGKLTSESYLNIYVNMGLNVTLLRLFNVYGPGQNMENLRQGMVSIYMAYILKDEELLVKGSPDRYRDLVYHADVIDAYMMCLNNPKSYGKAYNVASGVRTHVRELLNAELKAFGYDPSDYPIKFADSTPGDTFGIDANIDEIKNDIGWQPKVSLSEGLKRMAEWAISMKGKT